LRALKEDPLHALVQRSRAPACHDHRTTDHDRTLTRNKQEKAAGVKIGVVGPRVAAINDIEVSIASIENCDVYAGVQCLWKSDTEKPHLTGAIDMLRQQGSDKSVVIEALKRQGCHMWWGV